MTKKDLYPHVLAEMWSRQAGIRISNLAEALSVRLGTVDRVEVCKAVSDLIREGWVSVRSERSWTGRLESYYMVTDKVATLLTSNKAALVTA